jgi:5-methyltetrahydrofolate--homocysteine methyltransferase
MRALVTGAAGVIGFDLTRRLLERGDEVLGVYCEPDREGRPVDPIKAFAEEKGVPVFQPASYRKAETHEQMASLAAGGVDVFWIETMSDLQEVTAAVAGCRQAAPDIPIVSTMSFDRKGRTMMGVTPEQALAILKSLGVYGLGGNCGNGPDEILGVIDKMHADDPDLILVAKANAGMPKLVKGVAIYDAGPEEMAEYAVEARDKGARIIGACCGSTADHIRAIAEAVNS